MKYAVIRTGGKQYRVSEGDVVKVEKLAGEVGAKVVLEDVLFIGGNGEVKIGAPLVANAKVTGEIVGQARAKKVIVFKKKRRKSYSRQYGHRQYQTALKITAIEAELRSRLWHIRRRVAVPVTAATVRVNDVA